MATINKTLGDYIEEVDNRAGKNEQYSLKDIRGISSITKLFQKTKANLVDVSPSGYKIVEPLQFAFNPNTARMGDKIPIALNLEEQNVLVSSIYPVFKIKDYEQLDPQYLWLWFKRSEFDRYARFKSHGSAREIFSWDEMKSISIPIPSIKKQREIVRIFKKACELISMNNDTIAKLEKIIKMSFLDMSSKSSSEVPLNSYCSVSSGKTQNDKDKTKNEEYNVPIAGASGVIGYTRKSNQEAPFLTVGRVGTFGAVNMYTEDAWAADNVLVVKTDYIESVNQLLRKVDYTQIQKGGVQGLITQTDLKQVAVPSLNNDDIQNFENKANVVRAYILHLERENQLLEKLIIATSGYTNNNIAEVS